MRKEDVLTGNNDLLVCTANLLNFCDLLLDEGARIRGWGVWVEEWVAVDGNVVGSLAESWVVPDGNEGVDSNDRSLIAGRAKC